MKRKLFLGIDLDSHLKKMLEKTTIKWKNLPVKWHREESLHLTLLFLGWVDEDLIFDLSEKFAEVCLEFPNFDIQFEKIKLAYKNNAKENDWKEAKMVWLEGLPSEAIKNLQKKLEESLDIHLTEKKVFRPHVTLGRMRMKQWEKLENLPEKEKSFAVSMEVMNVTLFESSAQEDSLDYTPIEVFDLME